MEISPRWWGPRGVFALDSNTTAKAEEFLRHMNHIFTSPIFNRDKNLYFVSRIKNINTLLMLDLDIDAVINILCTLKPQDCFKIEPDKKNKLGNYVFIFLKLYINTELYIKIKIDDRYDDKIICISFHEAEY